MPDTETALPTFQQAYASAKEEVESKPAETEDTEAREAGETETATEPETEQKEEADQSPETSEETLLPQEEVGKLKGEALKQYKAMQKAYTQKTQKLAQERKALEEYQGLIDQFKTNPTETISKLAQYYGLRVEEPEKARVEQTTKTAVDESVQELRQALGPEGEILADRLASALENMARPVAQNLVKNEVEPIKQQQEQMTAEALAAEAQADLEAFSTKRPDWKEYESKMVEIGQRFQPAVGSNMTSEEYMETLYILATKDKSDAKTTSEVVSRLNKAVKSASQATAEVKANNVSPTAPKKPSFQEAWQAAKRGEKWE